MDIFKSGSKIRLKKSIFSLISFCQITFQQQAIYESVFLKSSFVWMHITGSSTYYLLPWPPHWIYNMANHGMCDRKCLPSQLWLLHFFLRYNSDILYISLSKVQWCVHGHWIHMQRGYEVNVITTSIFLFNPACSIYVKILWWHSCP